VKINIIDTPGHADFGGEVERALSMADGAVLLVDASEGPLPQTRFVLKKTLDLGLPIIVAVNKIDRQDARPDEVLDEVYDLFIDLDADEDQLDFPVLYAIGRDGVASEKPEAGRNLDPLFKLILERIPAPKGDVDAPFQMLVSDLGYSDYLGRLAIGKVRNGAVRQNDQLARIADDGKPRSMRATRIQAYMGLTLVDVDKAVAGDIIVVAGPDEMYIGDTICAREEPLALPRISVDEPTVAMTFTINTSPLAGREGDIVQASKIWERLQRETLTNVAVRLEKSEARDQFVVKGRGEFQLAIIIETMRREGFELTVGRPQVILKEVDGQTCEPMEHLFVDVDEQFMGVVTEKLQARKGRMTNLVNHGKGRVRLEFSMPARGLIGYRDEFLTDTKGTGIMNSLFSGYEAWRGEFPSRYSGSLVADRPGAAVAYALYNLEPRGILFVRAGDAVYEGMIVGEHNRDNDLDVNVCKEKKLTNVRAAGKDDAVVLTTVKPMTLERALNFIRDDEMVEVTPQNIRLRKAELNATKRHTQRGAKKKAK
jgi:GTP-binding protein